MGSLAQFELRSLRESQLKGLATRPISGSIKQFREDTAYSVDSCELIGRGVYRAYRRISKAKAKAKATLTHESVSIAYRE